MSSAIRFGLCTPHHGWLPVRLDAPDVALTFDASDVPFDPVETCIAAVALASHGFAASCEWHLEPAAYRFSFTPTGAEVRLEIAYAADWLRGDWRTEATITGTRAEILNPFWRGLRRFQAQTLEEPHWPATDFSGLPAEAPA